MDFNWEGQQRYLQGIESQLIEHLSFKAMSKELRHRSSVYAICMETSSTVLPDGLHLDMQKLLTQFSDIYQKPSHLPPEREIATTSISKKVPTQ